MKTVTIIIPTFNRRYRLEKCIQSIRAQTYDNWECLVVDDFSTDNTKEFVERISKEDHRIRYLLNERSKGAQGARNTGILKARADWIAFNDSDDEWLHDKLEKQMTILRENNFEPDLVVYGDCLVVDDIKGSKEIWNLDAPEVQAPVEFFLNNSSILFPTVITSKEALTKAGLLDEDVPSYQEWDMGISLAKFCTFIHISEPLFIYHKHDDETISRDLKRDIEGANHIKLKYRADYIQRFGKTAFENSLLTNIHRIVGYNYWSLGLTLLQKAKPYISGKTFLMWYWCFRLRQDPKKGKKHLMKNILRKYIHV